MEVPMSPRLMTKTNVKAWAALAAIGWIAGCSKTTNEDDIPRGADTGLLARGARLGDRGGGPRSAGRRGRGPDRVRAGPARGRGLGGRVRGTTGCRPDGRSRDG